MKEDFENYNIEDEDDAKHYTMWSIVPRIMTTPASGWLMARDRGPTAEMATLRFLLPLSLLSGASDFLSLLYPLQNTFQGVLVGGVINFFSFFLGYYIALVLARLFLPKEGRDFPTSNYGRLLTMTGIATLAIFHIVSMALPMLDFIFEFLPLWTLFLIYRGMHLADFKTDKSFYALGVMCVTVICSPMLVLWIFSFFT